MGAHRAAHLRVPEVRASLLTYCCLVYHLPLVTACLYASAPALSGAADPQTQGQSVVS